MRETEPAPSGQCPLAEDFAFRPIKHFILFHGKRHPSKPDGGSVEALVTHLSGMSK